MQFPPDLDISCVTMSKSMQDTVQIPLPLLRTLLAELDGCADFLRAHPDQQEENVHLPSDWFRCLILTPQATGDDVELYSDDVRKLIERCLSAIRGLVGRYRRTVDGGVDALRMLEVERGRLDMLVDGDVYGHVLEVRMDRRTGTGIEELELEPGISSTIERAEAEAEGEAEAKGEGERDVDGYDFDADHGY